jgi:hypothetical protein
LCALCGKRGRRACPALGQSICAVCCGTKRQREIRCPADCGYLSAAREHPAAAVQRRHERDLRFFVPLVAELTEPQYRLLLFLQAVTLEHAAGALPALRDEDVADAAGAVASTLDTAGKGIIYEHQAASVPAQRLAGELGRAISELSGREGTPASIERDAAAALRRLQQGASTAGAALTGDDRPVFLGLLRRLMSEQPGRPTEAKPDSPPSRPEGGGLIIAP